MYLPLMPVSAPYHSQEESESGAHSGRGWFTLRTSCHLVLIQGISLTGDVGCYSSVSHK